MTFLRCLVALAADDGEVNPAEYDLVVAVASAGQVAAVDVHAALSQVNAPMPLKDALNGLKAVWAGAPENERRELFRLATPMLVLQGDVGRQRAQDFTAALGLKLASHELTVFGAGPEPSMWDTVTRHSMRRIKGRQMLPIAQRCVRLTGDLATAQALVAYLDGKAELDEVRHRYQQALQRLIEALDTFEQHRQVTVQDAGDGASHKAHADRLFQQVGQRLAMVQARIDHEKAQFEDDFEEFIHDAGNAVELEMSDRLKTDDATLARVWESMGRSTFAKELERRVDRFARRHEKQLQLMKEDLRLFREEFTLVQASVFRRQHHTQLQSLMPNLRVMTQVKNAIESAADTTLGAGVLAGLGTGAAIYTFGAAAVLPLIAPVVPFASGVVLVAGLIKWMMDSNDRKDKEVAHKREAFEKALRDRLNQMRESYFGQLDAVGRDFLETANVLIRPVILEAEALARQAEMQARVGQQVLFYARSAVKEIGEIPS